MTTINEALRMAIRSAAVYNSDVQAAPLCILWPDGDRQWEPVAARLQVELPEMFILGDYDIEKRTGPAIWLRCVIAWKAPKRYPNIPDQIRKCKAPSDTFFWLMDEGSYDGWPQWNQEQENALRSDLLALANLPAHEARKQLLDIGKRHDRRRSLVWTELGEAPLACAVAYLVN